MKNIDLRHLLNKFIITIFNRLPIQILEAYIHFDVSLFVDNLTEIIFKDQPMSVLSLPEQFSC